MWSSPRGTSKSCATGLSTCASLSSVFLKRVRCGQSSLSSSRSCARYAPLRESPCYDVVTELTARWTKEDYEIFDLVHDLKAEEGTFDVLAARDGSSAQPVGT